MFILWMIIALNQYSIKYDIYYLLIFYKITFKLDFILYKITIILLWDTV